MTRRFLIGGTALFFFFGGSVYAGRNHEMVDYKVEICQHPSDRELSTKHNLGVCNKDLGGHGTNQAGEGGGRCQACEKAHPESPTACKIESIACRGEMGAKQNPPDQIYRGANQDQVITRRRGDTQTGAEENSAGASEASESTSDSD